MKTKGVPACTVQPYFRGIAISTSDSEALVFNSKTLGPFPEKSIKIYDGYLEYDLEAKFDVWLDFGLDMKIPKLFPLGEFILISIAKSFSICYFVTLMVSNMTLIFHSDETWQEPRT
jgi:hypothetical protein